MFEWLISPEAWIALGTLTALEIVLGIDNIIFISILVGRLPENQRNFGRRVGLGLAMLARLALLFSIAWVMGLTAPWFTVFSRDISGRDVILILGGLFLLGKSTHEIHHSLEGVTESKDKTTASTLGRREGGPSPGRRMPGSAPPASARRGLRARPTPSSGRPGRGRPC